RDPVLNVYLMALTLRDALSRPQDEFWAARREGEITGLLHVGAQSGAVLPAGADEAALEVLADRAVTRLGVMPPRFQVIGPRAAVSTLSDRFRDVGLIPRLARHQLYMSVERGGLRRFERL